LNYAAGNLKGTSTNRGRLREQAWRSVLCFTKLGSRLGYQIEWNGRFAEGQAAKPVAERRVELPHVIFRGEEADIDVALNPVGHNGNRLPVGSYEVWIGLVQEHIT